MAPSPASPKWLPFLVAGYGFCAAYVFAFFVYGRQGVMEATIDLNGFGALGRSLARGHGFSFGHGPTLRRAPLYPLLGSIALRLFGGELNGKGIEVYRPIILLNCLLFGLTCLVVFHTARQLFGARVALLAAAVCPLVPQSMRYVGMSEVETLMGLLIASLGLFGTRLAGRPSAANGALFGGTAAAAALAKPVILLYPFAFIAGCFLHWRRDGATPRAMVRASLALFAAFLLPLATWSLRNMSVTEGRFKGISSNAPGEFLRGYINAQPKYYLLKQDFGGSGSSTEKWDSEANAYEERLLAAHGVAFARCFWDANGELACVPPPPPEMSAAMLEVEKDEIESAEAKRRVLHDPLEFVGKFTVQLFTFWYLVETRRKSLMVGAIALAFLALGAVGARRAWLQGALVWPVLAILAYVNAIYAVFLAFARYSMPLFPTLTALSAGGLSYVVARVFARARKDDSQPTAATSSPPAS